VATSLRWTIADLDRFPQPLDDTHFAGNTLETPLLQGFRLETASIFLPDEI
jgi:hypothetical protein